MNYFTSFTHTHNNYIRIKICRHQVLNRRPPLIFEPMLEDYSCIIIKSSPRWSSSSVCKARSHVSTCWWPLTPDLMCCTAASNRFTHKTCKWGQRLRYWRGLRFHADLQSPAGFYAHWESVEQVCEHLRGQGAFPPAHEGVQGLSEDAGDSIHIQAAREPQLRRQTPGIEPSSQDIGFIVCSFWCEARMSVSLRHWLQLSAVHLGSQQVALLSTLSPHRGMRWKAHENNRSHYFSTELEFVLRIKAGKWRLW